MLSPVLTTGYGLGVFEVQGFIGHDGAIDGFSTAMFHLPETDATIVVVGNHSTNFTTPSVDVFIHIAQLLFPDGSRLPEREARQAGREAQRARRPRAGRPRSPVLMYLG